MTTLINEAIYRILTNTSLPTVGDPLVNYYDDPETQIVAFENPENVILPQIYYQNLDSPGRYDNPDRWERWRFFFRDFDPVDVNSKRDLAYSSLQRGAGTVDSFNISFIQCIDRGLTPYKVEGTNYWETYSDYRILYNVEE
jgi:hypothetical protein